MHCVTNGAVFLLRLTGLHGDSTVKQAGFVKLPDNQWDQSTLCKLDISEALNLASDRVTDQSHLVDQSWILNSGGEMLSQEGFSCGER